MHGNHFQRHTGHHPRAAYARHGRHPHRRHRRGGPRARRGDVRAAILALLSERPMHGYEMIKELEERTGGVWTPSAGSIYPTLQLLEEAGLIAGTEDGGKRRFELTESGREENAKRDGDAPWDEVTEGADSELVSLAIGLKQLNAAVAQVFKAGGEEQRRRVAELLDETRRKIYAVLAE